MDTKKAEELMKLTKEFAEKFAEIAKEDKDSALVLSMRATGDDGVTHSTTAVVGTMFNTMMAVHHLDEKTSIVKDYALANAAIELDKLMDGAFFERAAGKGDNASSSNESSTDGEQGE